MKIKKNYNMDNFVYEIHYKYTITGGMPCETAEWNTTTIVAEHTTMAEIKLEDHLIGKNKSLECFTELTLIINNVQRIGKVDII